MASDDTLHEDRHSDEWPEGEILAMRHALVDTLQSSISVLCANLTAYQPQCLNAPPPRVDSEVGRSCAGIQRMSTSEFVVRDE